MSTALAIPTTPRCLIALTCAFALSWLAATEPASAGSFNCMGAISNAKATEIMGVRAQVVAGGGGIDDCGVNARGYQHIIVTGYVVKRSFFDRVRRTTRSGKRSGDGATVEYTQRKLSGFGGPAFSLETKSWFEGQSKPSIVRSVFVYRHGRMLRPTTPDVNRDKVATIGQLVRLARVAAKRL